MDCLCLYMGPDNVEHSQSPMGKEKATRSYSYPIIVGGKKRGKVEAYYKERAGFLPEEKKFDERSEPDDFQNH